MYLEWMRYAGWLLTCPVLLMTLVRSTCTRTRTCTAMNIHECTQLTHLPNSVPLDSMTTEEGTKAPTVRLVPLLVANLTMILFGITAGLTTSGAKWFIFGGALCFGGFVFSSAIQVMTIDLTLALPASLHHSMLFHSHHTPLFFSLPSSASSR